MVLQEEFIEINVVHLAYLLVNIQDHFEEDLSDREEVKGDLAFLHDALTYAFIYLLVHFQKEEGYEQIDDAYLQDLPYENDEEVGHA